MSAPKVTTQRNVIIRIHSISFIFKAFGVHDMTNNRNNFNRFRFSYNFFFCSFILNFVLLNRCFILCWMKQTILALNVCHIHYLHTENMHSYMTHAHTLGGSGHSNTKKYIILSNLKWILIGKQIKNTKQDLKLKKSKNFVLSLIYIFTLLLICRHHEHCCRWYKMKTKEKSLPLCIPC